MYAKLFHLVGKKPIDMQYVINTEKHRHSIRNKHR
jgi:hypothetical protein